MRKTNYPTNLTDKQWQVIENILESKKRKRKRSLRDIMKAFGETVDLNDPNVIKAMSSNIAGYVVIKEFDKILREMVVEQKQPDLIS